MHKHQTALFLAITILFSLGGTIQAARVILKDGKIVEGKILAETDGDVLIKTSPMNRPMLLPSDKILSVVHDPPAIVVKDPQRYIDLEWGLTGSGMASSEISLDPAAGIRLGGGLRLHPLIEVAAAFDWEPAMSGSFAATDGTTTRGYQRFFSYGGGFSARFFPLYRFAWKAEPFVLTGYEWRHLIPKESGDVLKGGGLQGGIGAVYPLGKSLFWQTMFLYQRLEYSRFFFLLRDGTFDPPVTVNTYSLFTGLAWHL